MDPTHITNDSKDLMNKEHQGFWYQFAQRRHSPWLFLIIVLGYTTGLYLVLRWIYLTRL